MRFLFLVLIINLISIQLSHHIIPVLLHIHIAIISFTQTCNVSVLTF